MIDETFDKLQNDVQNDDDLHILEQNNNDNILITTMGRRNYSTRPMENGDRIVPIQVHHDDSDVSYLISANEWIEMHDYGSNEVEWSALSIDEAIALAKCAFDHEQYEEQPVVTEDQ